MKKYIFFLFIGIWAFIMPGCSNDDVVVVPEPEEEVVVDEIVEYSFNSVETHSAQQLNNFNVEFFKNVVLSNFDKANIVCSPLSASIILAMVANSTDDDLSNEITKALGCSDMETLNSLSQKYTFGLPTVDDAVQYTSLSSIWYNKNLKVNPSFAATTKRYFGTSHFAADFVNSPSNVVKDINNWVEQSTQGMIKEMLSGLPADRNSISINALYFQGAWTKPFKEKETIKDTFFGVNSTSTVNMMYQHTFQYISVEDEYVSIKKEIGNGFYEAYFILPLNDMDSFIANTDLGSVIDNKYTPELLKLYLPRFKYEPAAVLELTDALKMCGINSIAKPVMSKMFTENEYIQNMIVQKTAIEFNEAGAKGASSSMNLPASAGDINPIPEIVKFDRPFVFMIRETTTGALLFAGKISEL